GIVLGFYLVFSEGLLNTLSPELMTYSVILIIGVALSLSIGFKRSRYFFILLIFGMNYYLQIEHPASIAINTLMPILLSLNILIFALLGDRGIISFWGRIQIAFISLQIIVVCWSVDTKSLMELVHLQTAYAATSSLLAYPLLQYLLAGIFIALLAFFSLIQFARHYGGFMGLITPACLVSFYSGEPRAVALFTMASAFLVIAETIKDMYQFAFLDELTGLYSRRSLNQDQIKLGGTYAIAMLDIDHFKKFNDTYGHDVGDQVLKYVAALIKKTPGGGKPYRYGGEEFTLIFTGKNRNEVVPFLEELQDIMKAQPFTLRAQDRPKRKPKTSTSSGSQRKVSITMSIGVADNEKRNIKPEEVIKAADKALYRAKHTGRDRICS
ncbi:MAG: GGDEF domain-containing protein, partial [Acidobacteriota bacterium]